MLPIVTIFGKELSMYAVIATIGVLISLFYFCRMLRKAGLDDNDGIVFMMICLLGAVFGGHLLFALTKSDKFYLFSEADSFKGLLKALVTVFSGSVFYGGLIGGGIAGVIWIKIKKLDFKVYSNLMAVVIPLFHTFGRIGCFFGGCCYGIESKFGFAVKNNPYVQEIVGVRRFPVQLTEACFNFLLFFVLNVLYKKGKKHLMVFYLAVYSVARFIFEFLRGDEARGFIIGLSTSQFVSVLIMIACAVYGIIQICKTKQLFNR